METRGLCYICLGEDADSTDHVIPKCLFTKPPRDLLQLPAHQRCHGGLNEGWLRNLLVPLAAGSPSQSAAALYSGSVWRAFANDIGLRRQTLAGLVRAEDVYSPGGVYLGTAPALRFDGRRVYPSLEKMLRGLYLHRTGRPLARDAVFKWRPNPIEYGRLAEYFQASAPGLCYGDVFDSRFLFAKATGLDASVWWLRFYRGPVFRCFVTSPVLALAPTA
jgi:hypothetical protein